MSYPYYSHVPFRPLQDKYALCRCLIIYLSPVNGFIIVVIFMSLHKAWGLPYLVYAVISPHGSRSLLNSSYTYLLRFIPLLHAGPAISWPWTTMAATRYYCHQLPFLSLSLLPSAFRRKLRLPSLLPCALHYRLLN